MANLQQVGIEFVTQGERELVSAIARVDKSQKSLESTSTSLEKAVRRGIATEEQAISAFMAVSKSAVSYQDVLKGLEQDAKMLAQANQANVNSTLEVDRAHKSARESAKAFGSVIKAMDQDAKMLADANQDNINSILGVDRAHKSARASANAMKQALDEQERASKQSAAANQEAINSLFGIGRASKSAEQSAKAFGDIFKAMDQDAKMADQAMQEYNNALLGVNRAHKSARESANAMKEAFEAQEREAKQLAIAQDQVSASSREAAAASEALQREKDQLRTKYDSVFRASQLYEKSLNELDRALEIGAVSATQHRIELDKLNAEYQQFTSGAKIAASAANRFAQQDQRMRGGLNNTNVLLQQAGFQVGDFAVQVQSGTNVLVAFGQQATQIVGTVAALAKTTRMITIFSGLGIVIPIITAIGQAFMRTRQEADEASSSVETFESKLESARRTVQGMADDLELIRRGFKDSFELTLVDAVEVAEGKLEDAQKEYRELIRIAEEEIAASSLSGAMQPEDIVGTERLENAKEAVSLARIELESARELQRQQKEQERRESVINQLHEIRQERAQQQLEARQEYNERLDRTAGIMQTIQRDTETLDSNFISLAGNVTSSGLEAIKLAQALADSEVSASDLTDLDLERGISDAAAEALLLAKRLNVSFNAAKNMVDLSRKSTAEIMYGAGMIPGTPGGNIPGGANSSRDLNIFSGNVPETLLGGGSDTEASGGGGGGTTEKQQDYLRQLQREAELKLRMIGLSEQEQRRLEIVNELKQKGLPIEEKRIEQVLRTEQALRRAQQAEKRREDIMNTVSSNIESALMSVVDGTKSVEDAFRGMLRNIILEIYKQQVAQPFAQQAGNFITSLLSANGNVFNNGSHVQAYANGGVVGGPTYFPMRNGSTGLMGEAGPEAIMPLKRTKGGKLGVVAEGGGGDINQTLVFNISANGDESVKRIVRDEAPRIAEQAKSAVVDAKRRGGSYGRAFR